MTTIDEHKQHDQACCDGIQELAEQHGMNLCRQPYRMYRGGQSELATAQKVLPDGSQVYVCHATRFNGAEHRTGLEPGCEIILSKLPFDVAAKVLAVLMEQPR